MNLFVVIECDSIFCNWDEIGILEIVFYYFYLVDIVFEILFLNDVFILLLLGCDLVEVYYVID